MNKNKIKYIHYGSNSLRMVDPIENQFLWTKPKGGLWASRKGDPNGWKQWCEEERFQLFALEKAFEFTTRDNARVLELGTREDIIGVPGCEDYNPQKIFDVVYPDFETLAKTYDAIEVTHIGRLYYTLYG